MGPKASETAAHDELRATGGCASPRLALAPETPPYRSLCTDCGLSRSRMADRCGTSCQFIRPRYEALERQVHGRTADPSSNPDEAHFGPMSEMVRARLRPSAEGAQWSGITTRLAERLLESGRVDAVLATTSREDDRWAPEPILVTQAEDMADCRGMKMGFGPLLSLIDRALDQGIRRLGVIGIPCQVHALRGIEDQLGLDALYVIGTPCSDNTSTENFHSFLERLTHRPEEVTYLEFLPDYHVELRFEDGKRRTIPFVQLPTSDLPDDFFPLTCRSCMDYVNRLADITVGYLAGGGVDQWLIVRNERGREMLDLLGTELEHAPLSSRGKRASVVRGFQKQLDRVARSLPMRRAPRALRPLVYRMQRAFGPRGLEFARARLEMRILEGIAVLRREHPRRVRWMIPQYAWDLARPYGVVPEPGERPIVAGGKSLEIH